MSQFVHLEPWVRVLSSLVPDDAEFEDVVNYIAELAAKTKTDTEARVWLTSPVHSVGERERGMRQLFDETEAHPVVKKIVITMLRKRILTDFFDFASELRDFADIRLNLLRGVVESAVEMNDKDKNDLEALFKRRLHRTPVFVYKVREDLLGGIRLKLKQMVIDVSLEKRLEDLQHALRGRA